MTKQTTKQPAKRGRPVTGKTKAKISVSVNPAILEAATQMAFRNGESVSNFISRAMQNLILNS